MDTKKEIPSIANIPANSVVDSIMLDYVKVNPLKLPNESNSMSQFILDGMKRIRVTVDSSNQQNALDTPVLSQDDIGVLKDRTEDSFYDVTAGITNTNQKMWKDGSYDQNDITELFTKYAEGYSDYTKLCKGSNPVTAVVDWNNVNQGSKISCNGYVTSLNDLTEMVKISFVPLSNKSGTAVTVPNAQSQNSQIYLRFGTAPLTLRETDYPNTQDTSNYSLMDYSLGWYAPLSEKNILPRVPFGGPQIELSYSHITGNIATLGSTRDEGAIRLGFKQPLYELPVGQIKISPYIEPMASLGVAENKLNFGQGFIPDTQYSLAGGVDLLAGVQACVQKLGCFSGFAGYHTDQTLVGAPNDHAYGAIAGITLSTNLPEFKSKSEPKKSGDNL